MEIHDFACFGVAHPNIVNVVDRGIGGETRQRASDRFNTFGRSIDTDR